MRILNLTQSKGMIYSSNAYLILGDWSTMDDVNTLIDVGNDPEILTQLQHAPTGVGKKAVEQVILTHGHFDHIGILPQIRAAYAPPVYAYSPFMESSAVLQDGQQLKCGDRLFEVIYMPGHSDDSICLYCQTDGALFAGDSPVVIRSSEQTYDARFSQALRRLCTIQVRTIYFGHGDPLTEGAQQTLAESWRNIQNAPVALEVK